MRWTHLKRLYQATYEIDARNGSLQLPDQKSTDRHQADKLSQSHKTNHTNKPDLSAKLEVPLSAKVRPALILALNNPGNEKQQT